MPSKAFVVDQAEGALGLRTNQRTEMLKLALPAGKYALIASGTAECAEHRSVICFIETTTTTVARGGVKRPSFSCRSRPCSACALSRRPTRCASTAW
jgi:hypothetical protein